LIINLNVDSKLLLNGINDFINSFFSFEFKRTFNVEIDFRLSLIDIENTTINGFHNTSNNNPRLNINEENGYYVISLGRSNIILDKTDYKTSGTLFPDFQGAKLKNRIDFFLLPITWYLYRKGVYIIHATAVEKDGLGLLFLGESGSGKTTNAYNLVKLGWNFLSDDIVIIGKKDNSLYAGNVRKGITLDSKILEQNDKLSEGIYSASNYSKDKRYVFLERVYPKRIINGFSPDLLIFCSLEEKESRFERMNRSDAFSHLISSTASIIDDKVITQKQMTMLKELTSQCECFKLNSGTDIYNNPEILSKIIEEMII